MKFNIVKHFSCLDFVDSEKVTQPKNQNSHKKPLGNNYRKNYAVINKQNKFLINSLHTWYKKHSNNKHSGTATIITTTKNC